MDGLHQTPTPLAPRFDSASRVVSLDAFRRSKSPVRQPRIEVGSASYHDAAIRDDQKPGPR